MSVFGNVYDGPFVPSGSDFQIGGYRVADGAARNPDYDPSDVVASVATGTGGWLVTYQNGAAALDAPDTGACWSFPIVDVFGRTLSDIGVSSIDLARVACALRVRERTLTAGSTVIIGIGVGDNADPAAATNGFGVAVRYPTGGSNRQVSLWRCQTGTWVEAGTGTADTSTFGAAWTYSMNTTNNISACRAYPLDTNFLLDAVPGTNFVSDSTARTATGMTHFYLWTGMTSSSANGATHTFDGAASLTPLEV